MIFSELYSAYYNAVARVIGCIIKGEKDKKKLLEEINKNAFGESFLTVLPALESQRWQLVREDFSTPLKSVPTIPLTLIQKQWLKAVSLDKRVKLFDVDFSGLEAVEPLFTPDDYYVFDKYSDGDDFENEEYIKKFKFFLNAVREKQLVRFEFLTRSGGCYDTRCIPTSMEYSEKDDKFRITTEGGNASYVNLSRITSYGTFSGQFLKKVKEKEKRRETLILEISDERKTCERCMLHFAHFEKEAQKLDDGKYLLKIYYEKNDELEMAIRVLSFGPTVKAVSPPSLVSVIKEKLINQKLCGLK